MTVQPRARLKYLLRDEVDRLLAGITHPRDLAIFTVAYWRGLRASEVGQLDLADWNPVSRRLYIHRAKRSNSGEYALCPPEVQALQRWLRDRGGWPGPLFPSERRTGIGRRQLHNLIRMYGLKAGIATEYCHMHVLRHSIAVRLVEDGKNAFEIKDWLGHRSVTSTEIYAQMTNQARDKFMKEYYEDQFPELKKKPKVKWGRSKR